MIITQTPLRVSLAGGGTDFPDYYRERGGAVLSTAIDKFVYCIVKERFDDKIYVNYSKKEIVDSVDQLEHELVREAMRRVGVTKAIEISFLADIPAEGSGLGSSSSVTVGVLNALYHYVGRLPRPNSSRATRVRSRSTRSASRSASRTNTSPPMGACGTFSSGRGRRSRSTRSPPRGAPSSTWTTC